MNIKRNLQQCQDCQFSNSTAVDYNNQEEIKSITIKYSDDSPLYKTERHAEQSFSYELPITSVDSKGVAQPGYYTLILKFCEPKMRVFNIKFGDQVVIPKLDIIEKVGRFAAHDEYIQFEFTEDETIVVNGKVCPNAYKYQQSVLVVEFEKLSGYDLPKVDAIILFKGKLEETNYQEYLQMKKEWDLKMKDSENKIMEDYFKLQNEKTKLSDELDDYIDFSDYGEHQFENLMDIFFTIKGLFMFFIILFLILCLICTEEVKDKDQEKELQPQTQLQSQQNKVLQKSLNDDHIEYIVSKSSQGIQILSACLIKMWTYSLKQWSYTGLNGAGCLGLDFNLNNSLCLMLYDSLNFELQFKFETYLDFNRYYIERNSLFYYFPIPQCNSFIGLSFALINEALDFKVIIEKYCNKSPNNMQINIELANQREIAEDKKKLDLQNQLIEDKQRFFIQNNENQSQLGLTMEEKQIIRNAGITKKEYIQDKGIQQMVCDEFTKLRQSNIIVRTSQAKEKYMNNRFSQFKPIEPLITTIQLPEKNISDIVSSVVNNKSSVRISDNVNKSPEQQGGQIRNSGSPLKKDGAGKGQSSGGNNLGQFNSLLKSIRISQMITLDKNKNMPLDTSDQILHKSMNKSPQPPPLSALLKLQNPNTNANNSMDQDQLDIAEVRQSQNIEQLEKQMDYKRQKAPYLIPVNQQSDNAALLENIRNRNYVLKHVESKQQGLKDEAREFSKQEEVTLTAQLAIQIKNRRRELKKNYLIDDDEESPWLDDEDD